jgi:hypothetical protein
MSMLTRKRAMRAKLELLEGTADISGDAMTDSEAFLALDPDVSKTREKIEMPGLGATLSKEIAQFGYPAGQINFQMLLRGSLAAPVTSAPDWGLVMKACGMQETQLNYITMDTGASGSFLHGEQLNFAPSGAVAKCVGTVAAAEGTRLYYELTSGTPTTSDTITGDESAASTGIDDVSADNAGGYKYTPDSTLASSMAVSAWSSGAPSAGDVIKQSGSSTVYGVVVEHDADNGILYYVPIWDGFGNGDTVEIVTGTNAESTATASNPITQSRTPSISLEDRVDGLRRLFTGCRGTWSLPMTAGQPARWSFEMQGVLSEEDTYVMGSPSLSTASGLIFRNASLTVDDRPMLLSSYELALNSSLAARLDPSSAKGARSFRLTDRAPTLRIDPEMVVPGVYDWDGKWDAGTTFESVTMLGSEEGNRVIIELPTAQVTEMSDEDRDGLLAANINCDLTRSDTGDDEIVIYAI